MKMVAWIAISIIVLPFYITFNLLYAMIINQLGVGGEGNYSILKKYKTTAFGGVRGKRGKSPTSIISYYQARQTIFRLIFGHEY